MILPLLTLIVFILQIITSLFYSSQIIRQNQLFQSQTQKLQQLKNRHLQLELKLSQATSIKTLYPKVQSLHLSPLQKQINLSSPND